MSEGKAKANRIKLQNEFESKLIDIYAEAAELLTEGELQSVISRFAGKVLPSGRG